MTDLLNILSFWCLLHKAALIPKSLLSVSYIYIFIKSMFDFPEKKERKNGLILYKVNQYNRVRFSIIVLASSVAILAFASLLLQVKYYIKKIDLCTNIQAYENLKWYENLPLIDSIYILALIILGLLWLWFKSLKIEK